MALKSTVSDLRQSVLSARTYQTYNVGYRTYTSFLASNGVIWIGKRMPLNSTWQSGGVEKHLFAFQIRCSLKKMDVL